MKKRVLVVDDEEKIRRIYMDLLTGEGYQAFAASSAVEANEMLKKKYIDLVLLDINMPGIDGSLLHQIVNMFHRKTRVIVCSVRPIEDQHKIIDGAVDYYDKSQGIDTLCAKIKGVLADG